MTEGGDNTANTRMRDKEMLETLTGVFGYCQADQESELSDTSAEMEGFSLESLEEIFSA